MRRKALSLTLTLLAVGALTAAHVSAQLLDDSVADSLEARVWLDRGQDPVVRPGDDVRVYYRTSEDAYAAIFRIDTDGRISLLFPQHPDVDPYVGGGRDYRLLLADSPRWRVRDDPGMGYFFMIASPAPLDFSAFDFDAARGWDLSAVGDVVYEDPYVAIDEYVATILPDWETVPFALDFVSYSVGEEEREYPRFLCYDCHEYRSYSTWNPYAYTCSTYQVVLWNDPYFIPRYRYIGTRVVFARPFGPRPRYGFTARVAGGPRGPVVRARPAPPRRIAVSKENPRRAAVTSLRRTEPRPSAQMRPRAQARPSAPARPSVQTRPQAQTRSPAQNRSRSTLGRVLDRVRGAPARSGREPAATSSRAPVTLRPRPSTGGQGRAGARTQTPPARAVPSRPNGGARALPSRGGTRAQPPRSGARARPSTSGARSQPPRGDARARPTRAPSGARPQARPPSGPANRARPQTGPTRSGAARPAPRSGSRGGRPTTGGRSGGRGRGG